MFISYLRRKKSGSPAQRQAPSFSSQARAQLALTQQTTSCPDNYCSVEEAEDLSSNMLGTGLVVVHDTLVGGKDDDAELTGG